MFEFSDDTVVSFLVSSPLNIHGASGWEIVIGLGALFGVISTITVMMNKLISKTQIVYFLVLIYTSIFEIIIGMGTFLAIIIALKNKEYSKADIAIKVIGIVFYFANRKLLYSWAKLFFCGICNCFIYVVAKWVLLSSKMSLQTKLIMSEHLGKDPLLIIGAVLFPKIVMYESEHAPTHEDVQTTKQTLGWESHEKSDLPKTISRRVTRSLVVELLKISDMNGFEYKWWMWLLGRVIRSKSVLPKKDLHYVEHDEEIVKNLLTDIDLVEGKAISKSYNKNFDMQSDESFSRIFFYSIGSVLLAEQKEVSKSQYGPFEVDLDFRRQKMRKGYRSLGAKIHFDEKQRVAAIFDYGQEQIFKPGDAGWSNAKMLAKSSVATFVTIREHLTWTHLLCSNNTHRECVIHLPPMHPIRRLLGVFTYNSTGINLEAAELLLGEDSPLHRALGFEHDSLREIFETCYGTCNIFEPFTSRKYNRALKKLAREGKFPYANEGSDYYSIVREFVKNWLKRAGDESKDKKAKQFYSAMKKNSVGQKYEIPDYSEKGMIELLSSIIFAVTAYHELVGNVTDFTMLPNRAAFRLTEDDPSKADLQSFLFAGIIAAKTSVQMPRLMQRFDNWFGAGGAPKWESEVWNSFQSNLYKQSVKVQRANEEREKRLGFGFPYFDPIEFECSVSV